MEEVIHVIQTCIVSDLMSICGAIVFQEITSLFLFSLRIILFFSHASTYRDSMIIDVTAGSVSELKEGKHPLESRCWAQLKLYCTAV